MTVLRRTLATCFAMLAALFALGTGAALAMAIWRTVRGDGPPFPPLGQLWFDLSPGTLNLSQAIVQRYLSPAIWDPGIQSLLALPAPIGLLIPALAFGVVARLLRRPT